MTFCCGRLGPNQQPVAVRQGRDLGVLQRRRIQRQCQRRGVLHRQRIDRHDPLLVQQAFRFHLVHRRLDDELFAGPGVSDQLARVGAHGELGLGQGGRKQL